MTKPFDTADLVSRLKSKGEAKGLDAAEDLLKLVASEVLDWSAESLGMHPNKYLKYLAPVIVGIKIPVMEALDKIDKKAG